MSNYKYYQPNKKDIKDKYGDCVIRALTKALDMEWLEVFDDIHPLSRELQVPFNFKTCYKQYLSNKGFEWVGVKVKKGNSRPTVETFCKQNRKGTFVLMVANHLVTVVDGNYYDTWDSGDKCVYGYWKKGE